MTGSSKIALTIVLFQSNCPRQPCNNGTDEYNKANKCGNGIAGQANDRDATVISICQRLPRSDINAPNFDSTMILYHRSDKIERAPHLLQQTKQSSQLPLQPLGQGGAQSHPCDLQQCPTVLHHNPIVLLKLIEYNYLSHKFSQSAVHRPAKQSHPLSTTRQS